MGSAERLIRGEAIRFMQQQRSDEQRSKWAMVLVEQPDEIPQPEPEPELEPSSLVPPPSGPALNILEEIMMRWGLKRINHPPIVIAKPIPASSGQESEIPSPEQSSAPPPLSEPAVTFSESRKKAVARKRVKKNIASI